MPSFSTTTFFTLLTVWSLCAILPWFASLASVS
jgi:ABC-type long-subunit fatty acid transport system fused permease/ATPase subunit